MTKGTKEKRRLERVLPLRIMTLMISVLFLALIKRDGETDRARAFSKL